MAVAATAAVATVVDAAPAPSTGAAEAVTRATVGPDQAAHAAAAPLPEVTEHAIDPAVLAAAQHGEQRPQQVTEIIQLSVIGGPFELVTNEATVSLERVPGSDRDWTATLPPVRVIDARGTHEGWTVEWTVSAIEVQGSGFDGAHGAKLEVEPGTPAVVAGTPDGLVAGNGGRALQKGRMLFSAQPGSGGGTYEDGGTLSLRLPSNVDSVVVHLAFTVA